MNIDGRIRKLEEQVHTDDTINIPSEWVIQTKAFRTGLELLLKTRREAFFNNKPVSRDSYEIMRRNMEQAVYAELREAGMMP